MDLPYHRPMAGRPSELDLETPDEAGEPNDDQPALRDGRETLMPSVTRSALSSKIPVIAPQLDPSGFQDITETPPAPPEPARDERQRGARPGDVIGSRYIVEGQLGRGGMGRVMRVRHSVLGQVFALKLIKRSYAANPRIRELFYREARLASALTHDNICSIVDFGQDDAFGLFMVVELL